MSRYLDQSGPGLQHDPYRRKDDPPYSSNADVHKRNEDPFRRNDDPYRRHEDPYRRSDDPYRRHDDPYRGNDNQHVEARGSKFYGDAPYNRRPQEEFNARRSSGGGFRSDSYNGSGGYGFKRSVDPVIYEVDHLVTFDVSPKLGVKNHTDGMERLKHMQMTSGVWTMRYLLSVDDREIVITEKATRKELESFPISRVLDPVNIINDDPQEVYNNIIIFIVEGESARNASEMHVFQCIGKPGQDLIDDVEAARIGKFPRPVKENIKPVKENIKPVKENIRPVKEKRPSVSSQEPERPRSAQYDDSHPPVNGKPLSKSSSAALFDNTDVDVLNRCFDNIESFVASLQQAANGQKKLEEARSSGTVDANEIQYLVNKARPPPAREFIDTFQKFKFSLNLLPKLKQTLKDPNAQELTHLLFAPLSLVVEASRDPQGQPKLASSVTSPLLNRDTCILLDTSLHANEIALWRQLGDSWNVPSEKWKGPVPPPYIPRFGDNSKPARLQGTSSGDGIQTTRNQGNGVEQNGVNGRGSGIQESHSAGRATFSETQSGETSAAKSNSAEQERYLQELRARNAKVCRVTQERLSKNSKELTVNQGEYVEVLEDTKKWWKVSDIRKGSGFIPSTILTKV